MLRIMQALAQNARSPEGDSLYARFSGSTRQDVRLAAALRGFFLPEGVSDHQREEFGTYLKKRLRPAITALIESDSIFELEKARELGWFTAPLVDEFLNVSVKMRKSEITVWFLGLKSRDYGFTDRDLTL